MGRTSPIQFYDHDTPAVRLEKLRRLADVVASALSVEGPRGLRGPQGEQGEQGEPGVVQEIVAGSNVTVDSSDPARPVVSSSGGGGSGTVQSVQAGTNVTVDATDPANPIINADDQGTVDTVVGGTRITVDSTDPLNPIVKVAATTDTFLTNAAAAKLLTEDDQTATFPSSRRVLAGTNVSFDDAVANVRTLNVAGSLGSLQFVNEASVSGAAATTLTLSGLNLSTDEEYEIEIILDNGSGSTASISMYYNSDTTATNYDRNISTDGGAGTNTNDGVIASLATGVTMTYRAYSRLDFDGRARTILHGSFGNTTGTGGVTGQHLWRTVSNVTSITLSSSVASALSIGSKIVVWKRLRVTGSGAPTDVSAVQSNDLVITSNASYQDTDVTVPLTSGVWLVTADIMTTQNATPKIDVEMSYTGTTTSTAGFQTRWRGAGTAFSEATITALPLTMSETTTDSVSRRLSMRLTVSTSGSLKLRAKQNSSSATSVTFHAGSNIRATKIS